MDEIVKAPKSMIHGDEMILLNHDYIHSFLADKNDLSFIEVGSQRGTGSTYRLSRYAKQYGYHFITVDADENNSKGAGEIISEVDDSYEAHHRLGEEFLAEYEGKKIGICYLDAFDLITDWPHKESTVESYKKRDAEFSNEAAYKMHLDASIAIVNKVIPGGFICFDDVWKDEKGVWQGKGKTAIPYLLEKGFVVNCYRPNSMLMQRTGEGIVVKENISNTSVNLKYMKRKIASILR